MMTKQGLEEFEHVLDSRDKNYFRNKKLPRDELFFDNHLTESKRRAEKKVNKWNDLIINEILEGE